jgi:hypothetical protein
MSIILDEAKIKSYYDAGLWTKGMVWDAVNAPKPKITQDQYTQITGDAYPTERPTD